MQQRAGTRAASLTNHPFRHVRRVGHVTLGAWFASGRTRTHRAGGSELHLGSPASSPMMIKLMGRRSQQCAGQAGTHLQAMVSTRN